MKRYTTDELIEMADGAIVAIEKDLKPKAEEYFPGGEDKCVFQGADRIRGACGVS